MRLSTSQSNIIETDLYYNNTAISNIGGLIKFEGKIDIKILEKALNLVIKNADSLRIRLKINGDLITQEIKEYSEVKIPFIDTKEDMVKVATEIMQVPFDLSKELYNFTIIKRNDEYAFLIKFHHAISDGWSVTLIVSNVVKYYDMLTKNEPIESASPLPSYSILLNEEDEYLNSESYKRDEEFWKNEYKDKPTYVSLCPTSSNDNAVANRITFHIDKKFRDKIEKYCNDNSISMAVFFEAINVLYACRTNNSDNITLCSLGLRRYGKEEKETIGMFNNILPMTVNVNWNDSFVALCKNIGSKHFSIFRHQRYPYKNIMSFIEKEHGISRIYDIMVSFQNAKFINSPDNPYSAKWCFNGYSELGFMFNIDDLNDAGELDINLDYRKDSFTEEEINNIYDRFLNIISQVLNKDMLFKDIEIVTPKEKDIILNKFNDTRKPYEKEKRLFDYLEENVIKNPDKTALIFEGKNMTYKEFNEKVNSLANYIHSLKINKNKIVGIMIERSFDMLIAIYATIKNGYSYMPIDPHFPKDRIAFMLEDSEANVLLTHKKWNNIIEQKLDLINLDEFDFEKYPKENPNYKVLSKDVAYVIYTSGSTGKPKGALIRHESVINRISWMHDKYHLAEDDVILQKTPYTFDVSVWELFWWSMKNATLSILIPEGHKEPKEMIETIEKTKVTHMHFVPSMLNVFLEYLSSNREMASKLKSLKYVFASGEALQSEHVRKFYELLNDVNVTLHNLYGPTECTVDVSYYDCDKNNIPDIIPIGKPVDNTELLILDKACNLLPIGVSGELHISGDLVGNGYLKRDDLTKEKFIKNTFYSSPTMYKTGDLAKWQEDGNIEYLGRIDNQIKIRGLRVELGDIENAILKNKDINHTLVSVVEHRGEKYLCAYYETQKEVDEDALKASLYSELPEYMVPTYFVKLSSMPLNANGKADRKALPLPDFKIKEESYVAPTNDIEKEIESAINEILKRDKTSITSDLLTIGMTSIDVIMTVTKLSSHKIDLKVKDFYEKRTIQNLAKMLSSSEKEDNNYFADDENYKDISDIKEHHAPTRPTKDILLTGGTGFLGIHLLEEIYNNYKKSKIYCLVRNEEKLREYIKYFTKLKVNDSRIVPIIGDLTKEKFGLDEETFKMLENNVSDIYHSAAKVSFFCPWEEANSINFIGTKNLADFAVNINARLQYISTLTVSGDILVSQSTANPHFDETNLFIGQHYKDNVYVHSKYIAEKYLIILIRENKLNANIYRLPNITWHSKTGVFQKNYTENDLFMLTQVMFELHEVPFELKDEEIYITPVDDLAKAIVLMGKNIFENTVFHFINDSSPTTGVYMNALTEVTYPNIVKMHEELKNDSSSSIKQFAAMYLSSLLNNTKQELVRMDSKATTKLLDMHKFKWTKLDEKYIKFWKNIGK